MIIGVPKEIKESENRVGLAPHNVEEIVLMGHEVWIEKDAGIESSYTNEDFIDVGAKIVDTAEEAWSADLIIKVKEPLPEEFKYFREGMILYAYLHLAAAEDLTQALIDSKVTAIAYETMTLDGRLPLLNPMSEIAGRMSIQIGAHFLEKANGGKGILMGGIPGTKRANVVIIGGGVVGTNAAKIAVGMGAQVTILDVNTKRLVELEDLFGWQIDTLMSNPYNVARVVKDADIVIGSVLIPGAKAPILVTEEMVKTMEPGSVIIDIAIDQGGNFETSKITTHDNPIHMAHGVLHYGVANIPGSVPQTATLGLTNNTVLYAKQIIAKGVEQAVIDNSVIATGVNTYKGVLTEARVAEAQGREYVKLEELL